MKARTPTSTLSPPLITAVTVPSNGRLFGKGLLQRRPVFRQLDLQTRKFVVAFRIAAFDRNRKLIARLYRFARALKAASGRMPSVL